MRRVLRPLALGQLALFLSSCALISPAADGQDVYSYRVPERTSDGWETTSLADAGLDEAPLARMMGELHRIGTHQMHGILVVRGGKLVFEEYFPGLRFSLARYTGETGFDREDTHSLASVTKSITSTLVGIALDQGAIASVQRRVFDFFPEHADLLAADPRRGAMTLEHLLLMQSGIVWNDPTVPYSDPQNDLVRMFTSGDPMRYALAKDLYAAPGTDFEYCNAATNIAGDIVRRATGRRLDSFADANLFAPLGITTFMWPRMSEDVVLASGDLELRPRDMAKIGLLFLRRGMWNGRRIVSSEWVDRATARIVRPDGPHSWAVAYGYGWWHWDLRANGRLYPAYFAAGWGGQSIVVVPGADLVFVTTAGGYERGVPLPADVMLSDYVLAAIR